MKTFHRRLYASFGDFWRDICFILGNRQNLKIAARGDLISEQFRERLMLMVTQVNGCRYCRYFHAKEAINAGISEKELKTLLEDNLLEDCPANEIPALLYAQHWAESGAHPNPHVLQRVIDLYGQETVNAIHVILRMIQMGNLLGNFWDYLLYRVSFGRLGLLESEKST